MTQDRRVGISESLVHLGRGNQASGSWVNMPLVQGSTALFETLQDFNAARAARYEPGTVYYGRYGNEASFELERAMAALEEAHGCISVSAGLTAITLALAGALKAGDHLLVVDNAYGPTREYCDGHLTKFGVEVEYFDPLAGAGIGRLFRPNTAAVMLEAPGSGTFEVPDIAAIADAARRRSITTIIDSTWATPVFCQPLKLGIDVSVHSGSKYISGHSDAMIGFIVCNERTYATMRRTVAGFGEKVGSMDVFLALRGLRTLKMRLDHVGASALRVATWLKAQPVVSAVLHPALPECPGHDNWRRNFSGSSGLFSIVIDTSDDARVEAFVDALKLFRIGVSWGGFESLVLPVVPTRTANPWKTPGRLVRLSVGHEDPESLIEDLRSALGVFN